jgi:folate-binding protein YgfZ
MPPQTQAASFSDLSHNALIAVTGDEASAFLQAQLTNDVEALKAGEAQWNGWCSPKGRLLATFLLVKRPDGYLAMLPAEIAPAIAKRLGMFVLRSRVKIRDASAEYQRFGVVGEGAANVVRRLTPVPAPMRSEEKQEIVTIALDAGRFLILAPQADTRAAAALAAGASPAGPDAWEGASIRAGIPTIVAATQDAFVPQMANFELVGGVSFRKGCYPGQEIVARTQYRGILKRRMALAHVDAGAAPAPGQSVYSPVFGDQAAGTVVNAAPAPGGGYDFLVVAQIESLKAGGLHLGSPDGAPIAIHSHPAFEAPTR